jgi:hypothetical protein
MGRTKPTDYSKLVIYKIKCNEESVLEFYVGSTTCFRTRKSRHKSNSEKDKQKVYEMIRANGGWENWTMTPLEEYPCNSSVEARIREEYWRETLQAKLNSNRAYLSDEARVERDKQYQTQYYHDNAEKLLTYQKQYQQEHADKIKAQKAQYRQENADELKIKKKQYKQEHAEEIQAKASQKFECDCGGKYTYKHIRAHERSQKHQDWEKTNKNIFSQSINEC